MSEDEDEISEQEAKEAIEELVQMGLLERCGKTEDGDILYRQTEAGKAINEMDDIALQ